MCNLSKKQQPQQQQKLRAASSKISKPSSLSALLLVLPGLLLHFKNNAQSLPTTTAAAPTRLRAFVIYNCFCFCFIFVVLCFLFSHFTFSVCAYFLHSFFALNTSAYVCVHVVRMVVCVCTCIVVFPLMVFCVYCRHSHTHCFAMQQQRVTAFMLHCFFMLCCATTATACGGCPSSLTAFH